MFKILKKIAVGAKTLWKRFSNWMWPSSSSPRSSSGHSDTPFDPVTSSSSAVTSPPPDYVFSQLLDTYDSSKTQPNADAVYAYVRDNALEKNDIENMFAFDKAAKNRDIDLWMPLPLKTDKQKRSRQSSQLHMPYSRLFHGAMELGHSEIVLFGLQFNYIPLFFFKDNVIFRMSETDSRAACSLHKKMSKDANRGYARAYSYIAEQCQIHTTGISPEQVTARMGKLTQQELDAFLSPEYRASEAYQFFFTQTIAITDHDKQRTRDEQFYKMLQTNHLLHTKEEKQKALQYYQQGILIDLLKLSRRSEAVGSVKTIAVNQSFIVYELDNNLLTAHLSALLRDTNCSTFKLLFNPGEGLKPIDNHSEWLDARVSMRGGRLSTLMDRLLTLNAKDAHLLLTKLFRAVLGPQLCLDIDGPYADLDILRSTSSIQMASSSASNAPVMIGGYHNASTASNKSMASNNKKGANNTTAQRRTRGFSWGLF